MIQVKINESEYNLFDNIGQENILIEYKQWFLKKSMNLDDITDIKQGFINSKIKRHICESIISYIDKYYERYLLSLTNIKKYLLPQVLDKTHSKLYIGVNDDGTITGIPLIKDLIPKIKADLEKSILKHYENIIGLHNLKGGFEIIINNKKYFDYSKLISILKKHTSVNIHILKNKQKTKNKTCQTLLQTIKQTLIKEEEYLNLVKENKRLKKFKDQYNKRYCQGFYILINSDIMDEFRQFCSLSKDKFNNLLSIFQAKLKNNKHIELYLRNGSYINGSIYSENSLEDQNLSDNLQVFLDEYKEFKKIKLSKNIKVTRITSKHPIKNIRPFLKDISCFNEYLDIDYCMIEINIPFIKDIYAFIGKKNKDSTIKILQRGFIKNLETPCTHIFN